MFVSCVSIRHRRSIQSAPSCWPSSACQFCSSRAEMTWPKSDTKLQKEKENLCRCCEDVFVECSSLPKYWSFFLFFVVVVVVNWCWAYIMAQIHNFFFVYFFFSRSSSLYLVCRFHLNSGLCYIHSCVALGQKKHRKLSNLLLLFYLFYWIFVEFVLCVVYSFQIVQVDCN